MKGDFHDDFISGSQDPVDARSQDFDWLKLYQRLDQDAHAGDNDPQMAEFVVRFLQMLVPAAERQIRVESVGLRLIALAWVLNPAYFGGSPSLHQLARRCGVQPSTLAGHTGEISRMLRWRNRGQRHAWNWRQAERPPLGK